MIVNLKLYQMSNNRNRRQGDFNEDRNRNQGGQRHENEFDRDRGNERRQSQWDQNFGYGSNARASYDRENFGEAGFDRDFQGDYNSRSGNYGVGNRGEYRGNDSMDRWNDRNRGRYNDDRSNQGNTSWNADEWRQQREQQHRPGSDFGSGRGSSHHGDSGNWQRARSSHNSNDRDWWDRTSDEVSSWFGDEEAERRRRRDKENEVNHRGKGPKGYKRSDERIKEDANDRLSDDPYVDASEVDIEVSAGEIVITGTVNSKHEKRRIEDIVESVSGVSNVENRIKVKSHSYSTASNSGLNTDISDKGIR